MRRSPRTAPHAPHGFPLWPEDLPEGEVELYFDIEAAPDQNLIYLHGVLVVNHPYRRGSPSMPCWRNRPHQERRAWEEFFRPGSCLSARPGLSLLPLRKPKRCGAWGNSTIPPTARLTPWWDRFFDVHKCVTEGVTLPIESYALKHIARWIGV